MKTSPTWCSITNHHRNGFYHRLGLKRQGTWRPRSLARAFEYLLGLLYHSCSLRVDFIRSLSTSPSRKCMEELRKLSWISKNSLNSWTAIIPWNLRKSPQETWPSAKPQDRRRETPLSPITGQRAPHWDSNLEYPTGVSRSQFGRKLNEYYTTKINSQ
jgi:hypothetical protein